MHQNNTHLGFSTKESFSDLVEVQQSRREEILSRDDQKNPQTIMDLQKLNLHYAEQLVSVGHSLINTSALRGKSSDTILQENFSDIVQSHADNMALKKRLNVAKEKNDKRTSTVVNTVLATTLIGGSMALYDLGQNQSISYMGIYTMGAGAIAAAASLIRQIYLGEKDLKPIRAERKRIGKNEDAYTQTLLSLQAFKDNTPFYLQDDTVRNRAEQVITTLLDNIAPKPQ